MRIIMNEKRQHDIQKEAMGWVNENGKGLDFGMEMTLRKLSMTRHGYGMDL